MSEQITMTKEEALKILQNVAANAVGNLKDHQAIQTALMVIAKELDKKEAVAENTLEKPY
jgi:hypothetical protein